MSINFKTIVKRDLRRKLNDTASNYAAFFISINDQFEQGKIKASDLNISFEFFPAKDEAGHENLWGSLKKLEQFSPKFFSVTFGAGGGERDKTDFLVKKIHNKSNTPVAGHLTCVDMSKDEINSIALDWLSNGINKVVALRGDVRKKNSKYTIYYYYL